MRLLDSFPRRQKVWQALKYLPAFTLTVNTKHGRLSFSSHDRVIGEHLFLYKQVDYDFIAKSVALMKQYASFDQERYVIDIGANIGIVCIPLVAENHFPRALAFEPTPNSVAYLKQNILQNGLSEKIDVFAMGLSSSRSEMEMELSSESPGDNRIRLTTTKPLPNLHHEDRRRVIRVPLNTLDTVLQDANLKPQDIQAIFLDVQGHEWYVLQGAQTVLATGVPLLMEVWPYGLNRAGTDLISLGDLLAKYYTHLVDMRQESLVLQSITAFTSIADALKDDQFTDVCLFRLTER